MSKEEEGSGDNHDFTRATLHPLGTTQTAFLGQSKRSIIVIFIESLQHTMSNYL
jgi:hypothetical protein